MVAEVRGGRSVYLLDLVDAWAADVWLFANEAAAPTDPLADDRTVFDFIAALHLRNRLDRALRAIDGDVALSCVAAADELFRRFTVFDGTQTLQRGYPDARREPWWWERVPTAGPVFDELVAKWGYQPEVDAWP